MSDINELIERIGFINVRSVPAKNWDRIIYQASALVTYSEFDGSFLQRGVVTTFIPELVDEKGNTEYAATLVLQLRQVMYDLSPEKGAWFSMKMVIETDGGFSINFDYETKPAFSIPLEDLDFVKDYKKYPRDKGILPPWLFEILSRNKIL